MSAVGMVRLGDSEWFVRFDMNAMCEIEARTNRNFLEVARDIEAGNLSITEIREMLQAAIVVPPGQEIDIRRAGEIASDVGLTKVMEALGSSLTACLGTEEVVEKGAGKPASNPPVRLRPSRRTG